MTEHLPECHLLLEPMLSAQDWCICDELRACEQRIREDERSSNFTPDDHADGMTEAYQLGLDAAREAVAALPDLADAGFTYNGLLHRASAIAAIDALKEGDD